jgi:hypothetical protein
MRKLALGYGTSTSFILPTYYDNKLILVKPKEDMFLIIYFSLLILIPTMGVRAVDMKEKSLLPIIVRAKDKNLIHVLLPLTPSLPQPYFKSN